MVPNAEKLIQQAQSGEKLSRKDRVHCIAYIMATMGSLTNREIGEIFGISERAVRLDKRKVKEEKAAVIKDEDIGLVIADIALTYDNQIRDIEKSKKACRVGTKDYLAHCKCIFDMQRQKVEALQNLGYYPKNLGNMTVEKFEYVGVVSKDGSVSTGPSSKAPEAVITHSFAVSDIDAIEAEFTDVDKGRLLEAPKKDTTDERSSDSELLPHV